MSANERKVRRGEGLLWMSGVNQMLSSFSTELRLGKKIQIQTVQEKQSVGGKC